MSMETLGRRELLALAAAGTGFSALRAAAAKDGDPNFAQHQMPKEWLGDEQIVLVGYQGMTAQDLIGPQYMLASLWGATVRIAAKTLDPIRTDTGVRILPDMTFADAPRAPDVLCAPGAVQGTLDVMEDEETIDFVAELGARARFVCSVCTGSLILGQAGLLEGYRVTSHWFTRPLMTQFGATPVDRRVVTDRNRVTGAGVTAGLDFGLTLVAEMRDRTYAEAVQLLAEYAPEPPFQAGAPDTAPPHVTAMMREMFVGLPEKVGALASRRRRAP